MVSDLKPYPIYKDSGIPWLGDVPEHWDAHAFRIVAKAKKGRQPKDLSGPEGHTSGIPYLSMNFLRSTKIVASEFAGYQSDLIIAEAGDTLLLWDGANAGEFLKAKAGVVSSTSAHIVSKKLNHDFLFYACKIIEPTLRTLTVGMGIPHVDGNILKGLRLPIPSLPEQFAIVRFLNHADRKIRQYIHSKQKFIKLLEEQKQAIIHRVVTCGLDPNVRFKSSGVEWLGDVPEHWEIRRNGQLFSQRNQTGFSELPILEVSLKTGVRTRSFENSTRKQIMSDRDKYKRAAKNDIAYNMMRMWQGAVGVVPVDGLVSPAYVVARPLKGIEPSYFSSLFRTAAYMSEVNKYSHGIVKDRNRLYWEDFKQIPSLCPPLEEQRLIADFIDQNMGTLGHIIDKTVEEIALIREYRTRLIADVVTGKLDVREAATVLPDESEEQTLTEEVEGITQAEEVGEDTELATEEETI